MHAIDTALGAADRLLARWQGACDKPPGGKAVVIGTPTKSFPGVDDHGGTFRTRLDLAASGDWDGPRQGRPGGRVPCAAQPPLIRAAPSLF
ncbi:hypothetical protein AB0M41_41855 [Streptomyces sp. NPDC051896]|uniref:hypothetical protein n=1 Tax=Streptomyces sp. NPDC051896 TaxID=3155416 RepID=UPI003413B9B9